MNGSGILMKEVSDDIRLLKEKEAPKTCKFAVVVKDALIRSLRLAEQAMGIGNQAIGVSRQNRMILIVLIVLIGKNDPQFLKLFKFIKGMFV